MSSCAASSSSSCDLSSSQIQTEAAEKKEFISSLRLALSRGDALDVHHKLDSYIKGRRSSKTMQSQALSFDADENGNTLYHDAVNGNHNLIIPLLALQKVGGISSLNRSDMSPFMMAAVAGKFDRAFELLLAGHSILTDDADASLAVLFNVVRRGDVQMLDLFSSFGFPVARKHGVTGMTALHVAAEANVPLVVAWFMENGHRDALLSVDAKSNTPMHIAINCNSFSVFELLLECVPETIKSVNKYGETPLHRAAARNADVYRQLVNNCSKADPTAIDGFGRTPQMIYDETWGTHHHSGKCASNCKVGLF